MEHHNFMQERESQTVLGRLYDAVEISKPLSECFRIEHKMGVAIDKSDSYKLNIKLLKYLLCENSNPEPEEFNKGIRNVLRYLDTVYTQITLPFERTFKDILL